MIVEEHFFYQGWIVQSWREVTTTLKVNLIAATLLLEQSSAAANAERL